MTDAVLIVQEYGFFIIVLLCTGAITGFLAGLFGVGGGAISVPVLYEVFSRLGYSPDLAMPIAVGTSLALIIPISISSALGHKKRGTLDPKILRIWTIPIFLGVIIGATIAGFAEAEFFQIVFVIVASLISLRLLTGVGKSIIRETLPGRAIMSVAGLIIGLVSAIMGIGGAFILVPAMIYIIGMPTKLVPGTSLFVTIFVSVIVTFLHAFNYGSIDLILVLMLVIGSIIGVQTGQKIGQSIESSGLKALLAVLLLIVGIAIAYDTFFVDHTMNGINKITEKDLTPLSVLVQKFSKDMPIVYSLFSIFFAIALGVAAAFIRRFLSDLKKKHFSKPAK